MKNVHNRFQAPEQKFTGKGGKIENDNLFFLFIQ